MSAPFPTQMAGRRGALSTHGSGVKKPIDWSTVTDNAAMLGQQLVNDFRMFPEQAYSYLGHLGAESLLIPYEVLGLGRGVARGAMADSGKRLGALERGIQERVATLPGGQWLQGQRDYWTDRARRAGVPEGALIAGSFAAPDPPVGDALAALRFLHGTRGSFVPSPRSGLFEFDPAYLHSGEGASVKGPGHYIAEADETGEWYVRPTNQLGGHLSFGGTMYRNTSPSDISKPKTWENYGKYKAIEDIHPGSGAGASMETRRQGATEQRAYYQDLLDDFERRQVQLEYEAANPPVFATDESKAVAATRLRNIKQDIAEAQGRISIYDQFLDEGVDVDPPGPGRLMSGWIDANYEDFLDLDRPLGRQSPQVKRALREGLGIASPEDVRYTDGDGLVDAVEAGELTAKQAWEMSDNMLDRAQQMGINPQGPIEYAYAPNGAGFMVFPKRSKSAANSWQIFGVHPVTGKIKAGRAGSKEEAMKRARQYITQEDKTGDQLRQMWGESDNPRTREVAQQWIDTMSGNASMHPMKLQAKARQHAMQEALRQRGVVGSTFADAGTRELEQQLAKRGSEDLSRRPSAFTEVMQNELRQTLGRDPNAQELLDLGEKRLLGRAEKLGTELIQKRAGYSRDNMPADVANEVDRLEREIHNLREEWGLMQASVLAGAHYGKDPVSRNFVVYAGEEGKMHVERSRLADRLSRDEVRYIEDWQDVPGAEPFPEERASRPMGWWNR